MKLYYRLFRLQANSKVAGPAWLLHASWIFCLHASDSCQVPGGPRRLAKLVLSLNRMPCPLCYPNQTQAKTGNNGAGGSKQAGVEELVEKADGFAEVFPEHKFEIVEILQVGFVPDETSTLLGGRISVPCPLARSYRQPVSCTAAGRRTTLLLSFSCESAMVSAPFRQWLCMLRWQPAASAPAVQPRPGPC